APAESVDWAGRPPLPAAREERRRGRRGWRRAPAFNKGGTAGRQTRPFVGRVFCLGGGVMETNEKLDYRETLQLPRTDFPMRANLSRREPEFLRRWDEERMYERLQERSEERRVGEERRSGEARTLTEAEDRL